VEDFGTQGTPPTHPELLDWLAVEFVDCGWSVKAMHRLIVTSATYRQSSSLTEDRLALDPTNLLLSRAQRPRLEAEIIRDLVLRSSGLMSATMGGPGVYPPQPPGVTEVAWGSPTWSTSSGDDRYRRGIYTFRKRTAPFAMYDTFDAPSGESCQARRGVANTPLQALTLLNDTMFVEAAQAMGSMLAAHGGDDESRICYAFRRVVTRPPSNDEVTRLTLFVRRQRARFQSKELSAEELTGDGSGDNVERATWTALARALFCLDETVTRN
jgi:hypothetical protein